MAFLDAPHSQPNLTPNARSSFDWVERAKARDSHHMIANSVAVDDSDAGACARGKRMQSRQLAVGTSVGTSVGTRITIYEKN